MIMDIIKKNRSTEEDKNSDASEEENFFDQTEDVMAQLMEATASETLTLPPPNFVLTSLVGLKELTDMTDREINIFVNYLNHNTPAKTTIYEALMDWKIYLDSMGTRTKKFGPKRTYAMDKKKAKAFSKVISKELTNALPRIEKFNGVEDAMEKIYEQHKDHLIAQLKFSQ